MKNIYFKRHILCIDLKSFFASVECVERGLDPFKYPLVVANPTQGNGAITLAVTPYLKAQGVKSRGRLYEIPKDVEYFIAKPRMNLYTEKSKEVVSIYLDYVSKDDLLIYSVDECFLDVTNYLKLYNKTDVELAKDILNTIYKKTHLTATCGIGDNMLLAKVSMDIEAKHNKDNIAKWTYEDIESKLWNIFPLSDMWGIGKNMEKRLNKLGIYSVKELALANKNMLKDKFGIMGEELWNHANGIDLSIIGDYKNVPKSESISNSQVLFKDYYENNVKIIIREMAENIVLRLLKLKKVTKCIGLGIGYSKAVSGGFFHQVTLKEATNSKEEIIKYLELIFDKYYEYLPIRKVTLSLGMLQDNKSVQINLFENYKEIKKENDLNIAISNIKDKYGKNSVLKVSNLLEDSTMIDRNKKTGGHYS